MFCVWGWHPVFFIHTASPPSACRHCSSRSSIHIPDSVVCPVPIFSAAVFIRSTSAGHRRIVYVRFFRTMVVSLKCYLYINISSTARRTLEKKGKSPPSTVTCNQLGYVLNHYFPSSVKCVIPSSHKSITSRIASRRTSLFLVAASIVVIIFLICTKCSIKLSHSRSARSPTIGLMYQRLFHRDSNEVL